MPLTGQAAGSGALALRLALAVGMMVRQQNPKLVTPRKSVT